MKSGIYQYTYRNPLKQSVQLPWSFSKFQVCQSTVNHWWFGTVRHRFTSTRTPYSADFRYAILSKVFLAIPPTFTPPFVLYTNSLYCPLSVYFTFASLSSNDLVLHACLALSSHLMQGLPLPLLPSHQICILL